MAQPVPSAEVSADRIGSASAADAGPAATAPLPATSSPVPSASRAAARARVAMLANGSSGQARLALRRRCEVGASGNGEVEGTGGQRKIRREQIGSGWERRPLTGPWQAGGMGRRHNNGSGCGQQRIGAPVGMSRMMPAAAAGAAFGFAGPGKIAQRVPAPPQNPSQVGQLCAAGVRMAALPRLLGLDEPAGCAGMHRKSPGEAAIAADAEGCQRPLVIGYGGIWLIRRSDGC